MRTLVLRARAVAIRRSARRLTSTHGRATTTHGQTTMNPDLMRLAGTATPPSMLAALQRTAGNRAVTAMVTTARRPGAQTVFAGGSVSLHGETTADYDGGNSQWKPQSMRRAADCQDCPADNPCLHAVGTLVITYHAPVTIRMPDVPDGLTACQQRRVRAFLRDVLRPHEEDHARRFRTYDGTTRRRVDFNGCGTEALQAQLQEMHDTEASQRQADADARSAAIDPFVRQVDLDCE
jgi:hypothetical protein